MYSKCPFERIVRPIRIVVKVLWVLGNFELGFEYSPRLRGVSEDTKRQLVQSANDDLLGRMSLIRRVIIQNYTRVADSSTCSQPAFVFSNSNSLLAIAVARPRGTPFPTRR